jgi:hypothetical protein
VRKGIDLQAREAVEAQILLLRSEFEAEESEALKAIDIDKSRVERFDLDKRRMAKSRRSDANVKHGDTRRRKTAS